MRQKKNHFNDCVRGLLIAFFAELLRMCESDVSENEVKKKTGVSQITAALDYVRLEYANNIRVEELAKASENFQMDHVLCETELTATYEFQPVFLGFVSILENFSNGFRIQNHSGYSYFHGKEGM